MQYSEGDLLKNPDCNLSLQALILNNAHQTYTTMPLASTIVRECWNSRETAPNFPLFYWYSDTYLGIPGFFRIKFSAFPRLIPRISMDNTRLKIETPRNSKSHMDT